MRKSYGSILLRGGVGFVFASTLAFASTSALPTTAYADASQKSDYQGTLKQAVEATKAKDVDYVAYVTFNDNVTAKITFLEPGIFRYNVDLTGDFSNYASPRSKSHTAKIQAQPDTSDKYSHPKVTVNNEGSTVDISDGTITISFDKATAKMTVKRGDTVVFEEQSALSITSSGTTQTIATESGEDFFGGGTQNGRFVHTGESINIKNESNWVDGGVSSPNPFYWSSDGYGVMRNTFQDGVYDFGATTEGSVTATHSENEFDAYYFVADAAQGKSTAPIAQDVLQEYYKVTGNPVLLPEYAYYLGHYNAYNRDMWSAEPKTGYSKWHIGGHDAYDDEKGGTTRYEKGGTGTKMEANSLVETLNGTPATVSTEEIPEGVTTSEDFSARAILDEYQDMDMPLGYFLPNDGYGAGYGQNGYNKTGGVNEDGSSSAERLAAVKANVENLKEFVDYAKDKGVATGLWTQSNLSPDSNPDTLWHTLRDFNAEVGAGVSTLKTDVAWVGSGYSFQLNGVKTAYDTATTTGDIRPNIVSLDGWAGSQRYAGNWTGDQTGGNWEYIRFHIPTFIGQSLSGNPNIGSDMDGIWGGNPIVATRDYQWKSFAPIMMDMDGWGSYAKMPYSYGDPYTGINRMYLKLKSSLMPYLYTTAASAANIDTGNGDEGLPFVRAIMLSDDSDYAASTATQYEYTMGEDFLVAPIYQNTDGTGGEVGDGDDVRNNIYLPGDSNTIWIDYWTGDQYRGGQVLNNFEAPLWKLPVFVKANAIIPMWEPNDSPAKVDRTDRRVEFFAINGENSYTSYEDDGTYIENNLDKSDEEYGAETDISYGSHVSTKFTSKVDGDKATFTAEKSTGGYEGYNANRTTTFTVNVSAKPSKTTAKNGDKELKQTEVNSQAEFDKAEPKDGEFVVFYNEKPNLNYNTTAEDEAVRDEDFSKTEIVTTPKLQVKFAKTDVTKNAQTLTLEGFENDGDLPADHLDEDFAIPANFAEEEDAKTPTSITLKWDKVEGATSYELKVDGLIFSVGDATTYTHTDLAYNSSHTYQVRARNAEGYSNWSNEVATKSAEDPWRNVPTPETIDWEGGIYSNRKPELAFDHFYQSGDGGFHSDGNNLGQAMTIDYGKAYEFTTFDYHPRDDAGNGTVTKMRIETSMDGAHWTSQEVEWAQNKDTKTVQLNTSARYIRLTPLASVGGYFSASELVFYKKDGSNGFPVGSITGQASVSDSDYSAMKNNCAGLREGDANWEAHVAGHGADLNQNGVFDVYDMSFTMSQLDGGTKKTDKVSGDIAVIPSTTEAKAGDIINVDVYANDASGVNAFGAVVNIYNSKFELVKGSVKQSPYTSGMENLSNNDRGYADMVHLAFANRGDKDLFSGTGVLASFQLKVKEDTTFALAEDGETPMMTSTAWLVGPTCDFVEATSDGSIDFPEAPTDAKAEYGQDAFDITVTNDALPTDDGTNAATLIQNGKFDPLFDDVKYHDGGSGSGTLELKWSVPGNDPTVHTPLDLHFAFKTPSKLDEVVITNRVNKEGTVVDRGSVKKIGGTVTFEDGTTQTFGGGDYDACQAVYTFAISAENKDKLVTKVDVNILQTSATNLMTISEIDFNYTVPGAKAESIELGDNATEIYEGDLTPVDATVKCEGDVEYPYFTVESSNPEVASVTAVQSGENDVRWYVRGNKAGEAKITVASKLDPDMKADYKVTVKAGVDTAPLEQALEEARGYSSSAYTEDSFAKLTEAVKAAEDLLGKGQGNFTKDEVASAVVAIEDAIDGLVMRPIDESTLVTEGVSALKASSSAGESPVEGAADGNEETIWHSNYGSSYSLPQWIIYDLGAEYDLTDVSFLPRQTGSLNGDIFEAELYVGNSAEDLEGGKGVKVGTFSFDNNGKTLNYRDQYKQMAFGKITGRYVMINVTKSGSSDGAPNKYCSIAETHFYGKKHAEETEVNVETLKAYVEELESKNLKAEDYTEATWKPYALALADAKEALANPAGFTQAEIDGYLAALQKAYDGLEKAVVPPVENPTREQLEDLVDAAGKVNTEGKPANLVQAFAEAVEYAKSVLGNPDATEAEVKAAYEQLTLAIEALDNAEVTDPDKSDLEAKLAEAKKIDTGKFTDASVKALNDAIKTAEDVLGNPDATEGQIKDAFQALVDAIDGLEYKQQGGGDQGGDQGGNTGNTGNAGSGQTGSGSGDDGKLVQTGDASLFGAIAAGLSGIAAAGAGFFARRKRK